jgi:glycosyltransferase involved in cell wall biosynthesis
MGLDHLITAMKEVTRRYPTVLVMIAGKGALKATLQAQIETLGLTNYVQLLGYVSDQNLDLAYRAADLAVIPTAALEGFGLIALESLAAGTPVGGIPEILRPFCEDLVFAGASAKDLCAGMLEALSGERHLPSAEDCIAYVQQNYTWPVITQQIKSIYGKVLYGH